MKVIKLGSKGDDVREWQEFLVREGYPIKVDGNFGPMTHNATVNWQNIHNNLEVTGIVNDAVWVHVKTLKAVAWGKKVPKAFIEKVIKICDDLKIEKDWLMACMAFESAQTFSPNIRNAAGSGAVGLIQFMPSTAQALGTTTDKLSKMSAIAQLDYVYKYFAPSIGRLKNLEDVYMAILWPNAIGKTLSYVLFDKSDPKYPKRYIQNAGLDIDKNGKVTKAEAASKVVNMLRLGLTPDNILYLA